MRPCDVRYRARWGLGAWGALERLPISERVGAGRYTSAGAMKVVNAAPANHHCALNCTVSIQPRRGTREWRHVMGIGNQIPSSAARGGPWSIAKEAIAIDFGLRKLVPKLGLPACRGLASARAKWPEALNDGPSCAGMQLRLETRRCRRGRNGYSSPRWPHAPHPPCSRGHSPPRRQRAWWCARRGRRAPCVRSR